MPKKSWKPGTIGQRDKHHIDAAHNIRFLTLDIDGPIIAGWEPGIPVKETIQQTYDMLASEFTALADIELGALVHLTAGYGNPEGVGPRMRLSFELKDPVPTREIGLFLNELKKRYSYLMVDPALYRVGQIVYTADPDFVPPKLGYKAKRVFMKSGTKLDWQELIYGFDVQDEEYAKFSYTEASDFQKKLFMTVESAVEEAGMVRERTDRMIHIICPWEGEHSSHSCDSSTSIFQAENGMPAFKCMHASCDRRRWRDFVGELQVQEILDPVALQECQHDDAVSDFKDEVVPGKLEVLAMPDPVLKKGKQLYSLFDLKANLVMVDSVSKIYDRSSKHYLSNEYVRMRYTVKNPHVSDRPGMYKKQDLTGIEAWQYAIPEEGICEGIVVKKIVWMPRDELAGKLYIEAGHQVLNSFEGFPVVSNTTENVDEFLGLVHRLFPDEYAYNWMMDWLAHLVQRPWEKPPTAPVHIYPVQGSGRGTLHTFISNMLNGWPNKQSLATVATPLELFDAGFNEHFYRKLYIGVEETEKPNNRVKNQLKDALTCTTKTINQKGMPKLENEPMYFRMFFMANALDALPIDPTDRRFFVYMPKHIDMKNQGAYFTKLNKLARNESYLGGIREVLLKRDISNVNVFAAPPESTAKEIMMETSRSLAANLLYAIPEYNEIQPLAYTESMLIELAKLAALENGMDMVEVHREIPGLMRNIRKMPNFIKAYNMVINGRSIKKKLYFFDPDAQKEFEHTASQFRKASIMRTFNGIKKDLTKLGLINDAHADFRDE